MKGDSKCDNCWGTGFYKGHGAPCGKKATSGWTDLGEIKVKAVLVYDPKDPKCGMPPAASTFPTCNIGDGVVHRSSGCSGTVRGTRIGPGNYPEAHVDFGPPAGPAWIKIRDLISPADPFCVAMPSTLKPAVTVRKFKVGDRIRGCFTGYRAIVMSIESDRYLIEDAGGGQTAEIMFDAEKHWSVYT